MEKYYNFTTIKLDSQGADKLFLKGLGIEVKEYDVDEGFFFIDTTGFMQGDYYVQFVKNDTIEKEEKITLKQNLKYVDADFDPRSKYEIVLEAIDAQLQNRATAQQRKIQVGDKSIEYSTLDELLKWREYFYKQLQKEKELSTKLTAELASFRRGF